MEGGPQGARILLLPPPARPAEGLAGTAAGPDGGVAPAGEVEGVLPAPDPSEQVDSSVSHKVGCRQVGDGSLIDGCPRVEIAQPGGGVRVVLVEEYAHAGPLSRQAAGRPWRVRGLPGSCRGWLAIPYRTPEAPSPSAAGPPPDCQEAFRPRRRVFFGAGAAGPRPGPGRPRAASTLLRHRCRSRPRRGRVARRPASTSWRTRDGVTPRTSAASAVV